MNLKERREMIKKALAVNPIGNQDEKGLREFQAKSEEYMRNQLDSYIGKISPIDNAKREYIYNFVTALLLEHSYNYKNTDIHIQGRFKSDESFKTKLINRAFKKSFDKPIDDIVGLRVIIDNTKILLPEESELYKERERNIKILRRLTEFRESKLFNTDNMQVSRKEYFENLQELLKAIQGTLPEETINLIESYKEKEKIVAEKIDYLSISSEEYLQEDDMHIKSKEFNNDDPNKSDFEILLDDFEARIDDKIYYQTLINQVRTLLKRSPLLQEFNIKILSEKSKITENGYVAKFIKLSTLVGEIEIQLQTQNQYREGVSGFASHMNYKYQSPPTQIPGDLTDKKQIEEYRNQTIPKLPEYFEGRIDNTSLLEPTVIISEESEYAALKRLYQVSKDSHLKEEISKYLSQVYKHRRELFENPDSNVESIQQSDITEFLASDNFIELKNIKEDNIREDEER